VFLGLILQPMQERTVWPLAKCYDFCKSALLYACYLFDVILVSKSLVVASEESLSISASSLSMMCAIPVKDMHSVLASVLFMLGTELARAISIHVVWRTQF
jgi:hypothetical protein